MLPLRRGEGHTLHDVQMWGAKAHREKGFWGGGDFCSLLLDYTGLYIINVAIAVFFLKVPYFR